MANIDAPKGFVPVRHMNGAPYNGAHQLYLLPSSVGTNIFIGDVVKHAGSSGAAGTFVNGINCEGMPTVAVTAATNTGLDIAGVVVGIHAQPANLNIKYGLASTNRILMVADAKDIIFEAQEDANTTPIVAASIGLNASIVLGAGSTATGLSAHEIDSDSVAGTTTLPLKVLRLVNRPGNAFNTGGSDVDQAKFEVAFNTHVYALNSAGA